MENLAPQRPVARPLDRCARWPIELEGMSVSTAHTALETLLLFQSLARYGTEATSFRRISELLKDNALVREATAFDTGRLSPEALRQLYHDLLKQEEAAEHATPPEGDDSDSHPPSGREGGRDGPGPSPSRKRKLPSPSPTAARDASRHATLLPQLVDRLYVRYKDNVVRAIRDDEARYQHLRQDIQQIELGQWDERLKQQPVPAAVEFAEGAPNESALHRDTPADPQPTPRACISHPILASTQYWNRGQWHERFLAASDHNPGNPLPTACFLRCAARVADESPLTFDGSAHSAPGSPLRPPPSPLSDAASPSRMETRRDRRGHTRGQASRTLGRSPASVSDATDTAHAPRSDARRTRRGMAKPGGGMSTRRRRGSTASSHTHDSTRATSRSRSRSRSTEDVTPITRVKDEHPSTPFGVATDHDIEMSGASTTDEVPHLRLGHAALMDAMELRGEGNKRKRSLRDTPEVADSGSSRHGTPLGPARSRHIVSTPHFARTTAPVLNDIAAHKHASLFAAPVKERDAPGYRNIIYYPQDLKSIKTAIAVGGRAVAAAAGSVGTPADGRESPGASGSAQKSSTVLITPTLDVIPPRAIVNSAQLEKELMRMFANAIMFNFDPDRGFGTGLADRSGVDGDGPVEGGVAEAEDDEGSVVRDTREMVEAVEKTVGDWRAVERSLKEPSM
ncbi:MAG: hypothetical protein M1838_001876 [Thelocarpon superellum]|nr:MAG: hypothetical protein M1838_001876 [Thelocarpon superellum]